MSSNTTHHTIRIQGKINGHIITILIDSGSTNSFIDPATACRYGVVIEPAKSMIITVADGNKLLNDAKCFSFRWWIQGIMFEDEIRVLSLGGCDMVLGTDWMRQYSPILFDFQKLSLTFKKGGKKVTLLETDETANLKAISGRSLAKLCKRGAQNLIRHIYLL